MGWAEGRMDNNNNNYYYYIKFERDVKVEPPVI